MSTTWPRPCRASVSALPSSASSRWRSRSGGGVSIATARLRSWVPPSHPIQWACRLPERQPRWSRPQRRVGRRTRLIWSPPLSRPRARPGPPPPSRGLRNGASLPRAAVSCRWAGPRPRPRAWSRQQGCRQGSKPRVWGVEAVAKDGRERGEEGGAEGLVVGGPYPVGNVPGSKGSGVDEKLVEARHGLDDLSELFGEPDLLLAATADPSRSASWTRSASPPGAGYLILRTSPIRGAAVLPA